MAIDKLKILIRSLSLLLVTGGVLTMIFFFPLPNTGLDAQTGFLYFCIGLILFTLGLGLFLFKPIVRKLTLIFSLGFLIFFLYETVVLSQSDHTGQGFCGNDQAFFSLTGLHVSLSLYDPLYPAGAPESNVIGHAGGIGNPKTMLDPGSQAGDGRW